MVQYGTNAGDVVQGGAGDDKRGREAQELRPQADEEESDRGDQAAAAHHEREGQPVILTSRGTIYLCSYFPAIFPSEGGGMSSLPYSCA